MSDNVEVTVRSGQTIDVEPETPTVNVDVSTEDSTIEANSPSLVKTMDYRDLFNKPAVEGNTLQGDQTFDELGLSAMTNTYIKNLIGRKSHHA